MAPRQLNEKIPEEVLGALSSTNSPSVGIDALKFEVVGSYTTFLAEYAVDGNDLVFHFFLPPEMQSQRNQSSVRKFWTEVFPAQLEPVVYETFKVSPPRVLAAYVNELGIDSWWLRAYGFGNLLVPEGLCLLLMSELDKALDAVKDM